jgi:ABC-type uncharacterized transport system YnjBCD substrate-binding protein
MVNSEITNFRTVYAGGTFGYLEVTENMPNFENLWRRLRFGWAIGGCHLNIQGSGTLFWYFREKKKKRPYHFGCLYQTLGNGPNLIFTNPSASPMKVGGMTLKRKDGQWSACCGES